MIFVQMLTIFIAESLVKKILTMYFYLYKIPYGEASTTSQRMSTPQLIFSVAIGVWMEAAEEEEAQ
jgi:hypothetical protein